MSMRLRIERTDVNDEMIRTYTFAEIFLTLNEIKIVEPITLEFVRQLKRTEKYTPYTTLLIPSENGYDRFFTTQEPELIKEKITQLLINNGKRY